MFLDLFDDKMQDVRLFFVWLAFFIKVLLFVFLFLLEDGVCRNDVLLKKLSILGILGRHGTKFSGRENFLHNELPSVLSG